MAIVYIKDLVVEARHGVHQIEREQDQRFRICVELSIDVSVAAVSDNLQDTLDYSALRQAIIDVTKNNSFKLIERLAQVIANEVLERDKRVQKVAVSVEKPDVYASGVPGVRLEVNRQS